MKSFNEFIQDFPTNRCCVGSNTAEKIYELLTSEPARIKMAEYADVGVTPLSGVIDSVIAIATLPDSTFPLNTKTQRQTVGRMVTASLWDLGYRPLTRARVLTSNPKNTFTTAVTYSLTAEGTEHIIKKIVRKERKTDNES